MYLLKAIHAFGLTKHENINLCVQRLYKSAWFCISSRYVLPFGYPYFIFYLFVIVSLPVVMFYTWFGLLLLTLWHTIESGQFDGLTSDQFSDPVIRAL